MCSLDALLSALSHPVRRNALRLLVGGEEHCLCELMDKLGVSQSSMSRHMACLKEVGLVQAVVNAVIEADEAAKCSASEVA